MNGMIVEDATLDIGWCGSRTQNLHNHPGDDGVFTMA